jgi:hypothetical protein
MPNQVAGVLNPPAPAPSAAAQAMARRAPSAGLIRKAQVRRTGRFTEITGFRLGGSSESSGSGQVFTLLNFANGTLFNTVNPQLFDR